MVLGLNSTHLDFLGERPQNGNRNSNLHVEGLQKCIEIHNEISKVYQLYKLKIYKTLCDNNIFIPLKYCIIILQMILPPPTNLFRIIVF